MPNFFKFASSSRRNNPYANPHHPNHNPISKGKPADTTTASTIPRSQSQPSPTSQPASPRGSHDFLAEARQLAGRDPVTGQRRQQVAQTGNTAETQVAAQGRVNASGSRTQGGSLSAEQSAYLDRVAQSKQKMGSKYDLFVQDCIAQREADERVVRARGGIEYYAPERTMSEFYAGGVRD